MRTLDPKFQDTKVRSVRRHCSITVVGPCPKKSCTITLRMVLCHVNGAPIIHWPSATELANMACAVKHNFTGQASVVSVATKPPSFEQTVLWADPTARSKNVTRRQLPMGVPGHTFKSIGLMRRRPVIPIGVNALRQTEIQSQYDVWKYANDKWKYEISTHVHAHWKSDLMRTRTRLNARKWRNYKVCPWHSLALHWCSATLLFLLLEGKSCCLLR